LAVWQLSCEALISAQQVSVLGLQGEGVIQEEGRRRGSRSGGAR
jgi:hypothetical protein